MTEPKLTNNNILFFSIIIPVHNEEKYIGKTFESIISLDYPVDKYEAVIVENASNDRTYEMAKEFEKGNIIVIDSAKKGVSIAKNTGIEKMNKNSDWTIFLDCDTVLEKNFLKKLNEFMLENKHRNYSVGTAEVQPLPKSFKANLWFAFYNLGHKLTKSSYAIQIIKTSLLDNIRFDESLSMGEDLKLIHDARRYGRFFYFPTKDISTSTRRFEYYGWFNLFFIWIFVAMLPHKLQRRFVYKVIR